MNTAKTQNIAAIEAAWKSDKTRQEIKSEFGLSYSDLQELARQYGWPKKPHAPRKEKEFLDKDPTPEEIAQRAAEVRARWSGTETMRRWVGPRRQDWKIREYSYNPQAGRLEPME